MILYHKNLSNLQELQAEKAKVKQQLEALGWDSPWLSEPQEKRELKKEPSPSQTDAPSKKTTVETDEKDNSLDALLSTVGGYFLNRNWLEVVLGVLGLKAFSQKGNLVTNSLAAAAIPVVKEAVLSKPAVTQAKKLAVEVIGGYLKWKAVAWSTLFLVGLVRKKSKRKQR